MSEWDGGALVGRLARLRVPLGFACGAIVLWLADPTPRTLGIGAVTAGVGEGIRIWAAGHLNKGREVTASGPYRWVAHPLYVGSSVIGAGVAIAAHHLVVALLVAVYLAATVTAAVRSEEAALRDAFGSRYDRYRREGAVDAARRFSAARAIANREHRAVVGLVIALLLLACKAAYNEAFWRAAGTRIVRPGG